MSPEPATIANLRSIRARAYAIVKKAGGSVAKFHRSGQVRGWSSWSPGVRVEARYLSPPTIELIAHGDWYEARMRTLAAAIAALRIAGWKMDDDGTILEVPVKEER